MDGQDSGWSFYLSLSLCLVLAALMLLEVYG